LKIIFFFYFSVFWDLYSAAPERRDQHPHSEEAKAFHDYVRKKNKTIFSIILNKYI
jgi:hypothetical protein